MMLIEQTCCCCGSAEVQPSVETTSCICLSCGHKWRQCNTQIDNDYYAGLTGRNSMPLAYVEAKIADRLSYLMPMIKEGMRILEIGCAEGFLGQQIKAQANVFYVGVELSNDALEAEYVLDEVIRHPHTFLGSQQFDLIVSFHVLEHIVDVNTELQLWQKMLKKTGKLIIEVPNGSGHPLIADDCNPEHIHQFSIASLAALLQRQELRLSTLTTGCFESPSYVDSIRLIAIPALSELQKRQQLIRHLEMMTGQAFDVFGIGGDFNNYLAPLLQDLHVVNLYDSDPADRRFNGQQIQQFDVALNQDRPILIGSIRYETEIAEVLLSAGIAETNIHYLSQLLMETT